MSEPTLEDLTTTVTALLNLIMKIDERMRSFTIDPKTGDDVPLFDFHDGLLASDDLLGSIPVSVCHAAGWSRWTGKNITNPQMSELVIWWHKDDAKFKEYEWTKLT
jgi:hypothetical protein